MSAFSSSIIYACLDNQLLIQCGLLHYRNYCFSTAFPEEFVSNSVLSLNDSCNSNNVSTAFVCLSICSDSPSKAFVFQKYIQLFPTKLPANSRLKRDFVFFTSSPNIFSNLFPSFLPSRCISHGDFSATKCLHEIAPACCWIWIPQYLVDSMMILSV